MKDKSSFLIILASASVIVSVFVMLFVLKNAPVTLPVVLPVAPTTAPLQSAAELDQLSADLNKTDLTALDKELNQLSSDSSGF